MQLSGIVDIPTNHLIRGSEKEIPVRDAHSRIPMDPEIEQSNLVKNLCALQKEGVERIEQAYGAHGLFNLMFLAQTSTHSDFLHYYQLINDNLIFMSLSKIGMRTSAQFDNRCLLAASGIDRFNHNVLQPELSRKLFNPGTHPGHLVYGLGGARILVSHPFRGLNGEIYNVYANSLDVVTSLNIRGYYGSFLFLDNIGGLNYDIEGIPAWLAWFSLIASHSDLVIFVKQNASEFGASQEGEIAYTPDRVNKKIVHIPADELRWAATPESGDIHLNFDTSGNPISLDEVRLWEAQHTRPFITAYSEAEFPRDRIVQIDEEGELNEFPLDYPLYG